MIKVKSIWLRRAEGLPEECVERTVETWAHANAVLLLWSRTAPTDGTCDKCDFRITFEDGFEYDGRFELCGNETPDLPKRVRGFAAFYAGRDRPAHFTPEKYAMLLSRSRLVDPEMTYKMGKFLDDYDLATREVAR